MFLFFAGAEAAFALLTGAGLFAGILRAFDAFLLAPPRAGAAPFLGADELFAELAGRFVEVLFPAGFLAVDVFFALDFLVARPFTAAVREGLAFFAVLRLFDGADFEAVLFFTLLRDALFAEDLDDFRDGAFAAVRLEPAELRFTALFFAGFATARFIGLLFLEAVAFPFEAVGLRDGALFLPALFLATLFLATLFLPALFLTALFLTALFGAGLRDGALFLLELFVDPPRAVTDLEELFLDAAIATPFYRSEETAFNNVFDCSRIKTITPPSPLLQRLDTTGQPPARKRSALIDIDMKITIPVDGHADCPGTAAHLAVFDVFLRRTTREINEDLIRFTTVRTEDLIDHREAAFCQTARRPGAGTSIGGEIAQDPSALSWKIRNC